MDYVKELQEKIDRDGLNIPGKNLKDHSVCKEILSALDALENGRCAEICFNDSNHPSYVEPICGKCNTAIQHGESFLIRDGVNFHKGCFDFI